MIYNFRVMQIFIWNSHFELFVNFQTCTKGLWFYSVFDWFLAEVQLSTCQLKYLLWANKKFCAHFLNWNLSSFSLLFLSPLISFIYFDFYLTSPLWINFPHFLLSVNGVQWYVFKCTDTWGVTGTTLGKHTSFLMCLLITHTNPHHCMPESPGQE